MTPEPKTSSPFSVTLILLGVLTIAALNLLRFILAVQQRRFLANLIAVDPLYLAISGLVWAAAGLALAWTLQRRWPQAPALTLLAAAAYSLYYWLDRLFIASSGPGTNGPFLAVSNLILLTGLAWQFRRPKIRALFRNKEADRRRETLAQPTPQDPAEKSP